MYVDSYQHVLELTSQGRLPKQDGNFILTINYLIQTTERTMEISDLK